MKRIRLFSLALIMALVMNMATGAALTEAYTHPSGIFGFTVPEGWIVVDSENLTGLIDRGLVSPSWKQVFDQNADALFTMIFETNGDHSIFMDTINVSVYYLGGPTSLSEYINANRGQLESQTKADPAASVIVPFQAATFGNREMGVYGYSTDYDGTPIADMRIYYVTGSTLYGMRMVCKLGEANGRGIVLEELAASFFGAGPSPAPAPDPAGDEDPAVGGYAFYAMSMAGMTITAEQLAAFGLNINDFALSIYANGMFEMAVGDESADGAWRNDGNCYALAAEDTVYGWYNASDGTFTIDVPDETSGGGTIVFVKK